MIKAMEELWFPEPLVPAVVPGGLVVLVLNSSPRFAITVAV